LEDGSVLLITGGAYGITAEVAKALASGRHLRLALVGRSARPEPESASTRNIANAAELRQFLIGERRAQNAKVKPSEIEADLKRILKEREIRRNLTALEQAGHELSYHAVDVSDHDAFARLIDDIYGRWGRIDGVIHGAGIVDDKLICDKSLESFDAVYLTKVSSALTLARKLRPDSLKFLLLFSSVAGRFGNAGQCDYSAANEVLNKLADRLRVEWPNVHAASLNWGPWEGGMVSEELIKLFALRDIRPIPMAIGVQCCLDVLARPFKTLPELVITASLSQIAGSGHAGAEDQVRQSRRRRVPQPQQAIA
jgi:NAD(P)-dependent dehydrogenase (short-subunit alcohol dehydrogenase family)